MVANILIQLSGPNWAEVQTFTSTEQIHFEMPLIFTAKKNTIFKF